MNSTQFPSKKKDNLISIEKNIQAVQNYQSSVNNSYEKYFVTFPYPYMNGILHLGHAYTLTKADFISRFKKLCGKNVLFPFGFHGTGMPIVACAKKLLNELNKLFNNYDELNSISDYEFKELIKNFPKTSQIKILTEMNISKENLYNFIDPYYWLKYFPNKAIEDLKSLGMSIDFSRSFVTTDLNPYYDLFVKWQFNKLNEQNLLKFGKRYVIYSELDNQPCADHDRAIGEGIEPIEYKIKIIKNIESNKDFINFIGTIVSNDLSEEYHQEIDKSELYKISKINIYLNKKIRYVKISLNKEYYVISEFSFKNLKNQIDEVEFIEYYTPNFDRYKECNCEKATGIYLSDKEFTDLESINNSKNDLRYFEPSQKVVSRSGDQCIVAKTNQWFINYGDENLKKKVNNYIDNHFYTNNERVRYQLKKASEWINEWPCSRHYGLGTKLLNTTSLIDSLSDSTIYMAYYTVSHLINKIPLDKINTEEKNMNFWNHIFLNNKLDDQNFNNDELDIIGQMKKEFEYWYPVDVRVSGKDLINNHLIMSIYNHFAIWDEVKLIPKSFEINGHILLNGKKMSKSEGNFKTLNTVLNEYGCDATRLTLVEGDGIEDADFRDELAKGNLLKLYSEKEWYEELIKNLNLNNNGKYDFWEEIFDMEIINTFGSAEEYYEKFSFRNAMCMFNRLLLARDKYRVLYEKKYITKNDHILKKFLDCSLLILYPVCPHIVEYLWSIMELRGITPLKKWISMENTYSSTVNKIYKYYSNNIYNVIDRINADVTKLTKKKKQINNINIKIIKNYTQEELNVINQIKNIGDTDWKIFLNNNIKKLSGELLFSSYAKFSSFIKDKINTYGDDYLDNRIPEEEHKLMQKWIPILLNNKYSIGIELMDSNENIKFNFGPDIPQVSIILT